MSRKKTLTTNASTDVVAPISIGKGSDDVSVLLTKALSGIETHSRSEKLFRHGVTKISISISTPSGTNLEVVVEGNGDTPLKAHQESAYLPYRAGEPESCRDVFRLATTSDLGIGDKVPNKNEQDVCGKIKKKIKRTDPEFKTMVSNSNASIVFKDEEGTGADRMMSKRLSDVLDKLATAVDAEWSGVKLRVTEAWDEDNEHVGESLHYEGRAADLTTFPIDSEKLGRLGRLAVDSGFDWVWYENSAHIHVSVKV